ncbi:MAG: hypothetical protein QOH26_2276 [Actinomycetota bacterium]|jgi:hypothetical protein|nr:hypothetical protein [Actinomycetota bacterium]
MRAVAAAILLAAVAAATLGSFLDWVRITAPQDFRPDDPGNAALSEQMSQPFTGVEARDGWWVIALAAVILMAAVLLLIRKKSFYGWISFLASVVMGSIVFADYRAVGDLSSAISRRMDVVGRAEAGIGLTMVAAAVMAAVVGSLIAIAASPHRDDG